MNKTDGRKIDREALDVIRELAMKRIADGEAVSAVMGSYGLCRTTFYKWTRKMRERGVDKLVSAKPTGRPPRLSDKQKQKVFRWINGKDPRQYGFDFGLWTRKIVSALVLETFGIEMGITAVGHLLAELGITPHKPLRRAYERDPAAVDKWSREVFPALKARARDPGYAPDLNPDEFVWNHMRHKGVTKKPLRRNESLRSRVEDDLAAIQSDPSLVRSFFKAPSVAYILD